MEKKSSCDPPSCRKKAKSFEKSVSAVVTPIFLVSGKRRRSVSQRSPGRTVLLQTEILLLFPAVPTKNPGKPGVFCMDLTCF
jgi:hypothetical protein